MTASPQQRATQPHPPRIRPNAGAWSPLVDMIDIFPGHRGTSRDGELDLSALGGTVGIRIKMFNAKLFAYKV